MSPAQRRDLLARVKTREYLANLWLRASEQGFVVRQELDRRAVVVFHPDGLESPEAEELRLRGPEVFDALDFVDRLHVAVMQDEPWRIP